MDAIAAGLIAALTLALAGCGVSESAPEKIEPSAGSGRLSGDEQLLDRVAWQFPDPNDRVAVAVIEGGVARSAYVGADADTHFEIGSITKVFTGELLAEAIERGEVKETDTLGQYLDLGDAPAASVTLLQLATHTSGLPMSPTDLVWIERTEAAIEAGRDPYQGTLEELLADALALEVTPDQGSVYSNVGAALLGHALAAAAGTNYSALLEERLFDPLSLVGAVLPVTGANVPATHAGGYDVDGRAVDPWTLGAYAPAGGIHATVGDLALFAQAVLDGPLSDSTAFEPTDADGGEPQTRIGYFWSIDDAGPSTIIGHNGGTGGFASVLLIDRTAGTAAIVLSNSQGQVDQIGSTLLAGAGR